MNENTPLLHRPPDPQTPTVASDLEGTLSSGVTVAAIHRYLNQNGQRAPSTRLYLRRMSAFVVLKAMRKNLREVKNGWMRDLVRMFRGLPLEEVRKMTDWVVAEEVWPGRRAAVIAELNAHLSAGRRVVIVSGMFTQMLESLLARLPGMEAIGTLVMDPGPVFSGELGVFNVGQRKVDALKPFAGETGRIHAAYGDTFSDLGMLELSENPVAVTPDRGLRQAAEARGWRIVAEHAAGR